MSTTRPWATSYVHPGTWERRFEGVAVPELLAHSAARAPGAPCLDFLGRRYTYGEVNELVRRAAAGFAALGVGRDTRVGLFLPNCPHYVIAYYGAMLAGGTVVNFSPLYTTDELAAQIDDSGTTVMVTLDLKQLYDTIAPTLARTQLRALVIGNLPEVLPWPQSLAYRLLKRGDRAVLPRDPQHVAFAALTAHPPIAQPPALDPARDVALLQYTGGTTGVPRGAVLTHANLSVNAMQVAAVDPHPELPDRILAVLPFFHVFANTSILNRTILRGGEIVMLPRFDLQPALAAVARHRLTLLPGVPTMFRAMLDYPGLERFDLSSLRICISGGAPLPAELKAAFEARTGAIVVEGYGLTESSGVVSVNPFEGVNKPGSIGQPLPATDVRLIDKDDPARPAPDGEPGEIVVAGPQVMQGYHDHANDAGVFIEIDGVRFLRTGDVGTIDADGYIFVVDRLKDMIVVGGFKVFPSRVEDVLYAHPQVKDALVIGIPDLRLGERPKAFVTLADEATITGGELCTYVNARVGKHERVVAVEVRATLPHTAIGKLSRKELVAEERAKAGRSQ